MPGGLTLGFSMHLVVSEMSEILVNWDMKFLIFLVILTNVVVTDVAWLYFENELEWFHVKVYGLWEMWTLIGPQLVWKAVYEVWYKCSVCAENLMYSQRNLLHGSVAEKSNLKI